MVRTRKSLQTETEAYVRTRLFTAGGSATASNPQRPRKWRDLMVLAGLIDHPEMGLILFETGCAEDIEIVCTISDRFWKAAKD